MKSFQLISLVFGAMATGSFGLSLTHVQQQKLSDGLVGGTVTGEQLVNLVDFSEDGYASIVSFKNDALMSSFVKRLLAVEDKFVPQDQEDELNGLVQWFSGTKATQSLEQLRQELSQKSWVKDLKTVDGATLSEADYQAVAALHNDTAMKLFVSALLKGESSFIPQGQETELEGFVPWFSGRNATQSIAQMRQELSDKNWVKSLKAVDGASLSEEDYQAVAAFRNDTAMRMFVTALLQSENSFIPEDQENELAGFVPWFSGTNATQSLEKLRSELSAKPWVQRPANDAKAVNLIKTHQVPVVAQQVAEEATMTARHARQGRANATRPSNATGQIKATELVAEEDARMRPGTLQQKVRTAVGTWMKGLLRWWHAKSRTEGKAHNETLALVSQAQTETKALVSNCSECIVWGDANILSFNAYRVRATAHPNRAAELYARNGAEDQFTGAEEGTYWLVKNSDVQIQGRYWRYNKTRPDSLGLGAMAISGPLVGNNILVIRSQSGNVTWNSQDILREIDSNFSNQFVTAKHMPDVGPVAADTHTAGILFEFANGMRLTVARYRKKLAARITVCDAGAAFAAAPMAGQCGNLEKLPREKTQDWLKLQKTSGRLQKLEIIFPDSGHHASVSFKEQHANSSVPKGHANISNQERHANVSAQEQHNVKTVEPAAFVSERPQQKKHAGELETQASERREHKNQTVEPAPQAFERRPYQKVVTEQASLANEHSKHKKHKKHADMSELQVSEFEHAVEPQVSQRGHRKRQGAEPEAQVSKPLRRRMQAAEAELAQGLKLQRFHSVLH